MKPRRGKGWPLRFRLAAWNTLVLAVLLVAFGLFFYLSLSRTLQSQVDSSLRVVASQAAAGLQNEDGTLRFGTGDEGASLPALLATRGYALRLVAASGLVLDGSGEYRRLPPGPPPPGLRTVVAGGERWRTYTVFVPAAPPEPGSDRQEEDPPTFPTGGVYLEAAQSLTGVEAAEARLVRLLLVSVPLGLVLSALVGLLLAQRSLRPIDAVTREARRIGEEAARRGPAALGRRLEVANPNDEVGRLTRTFNAMLDRLEKAFRRERRFTADAAHELRTPLTVLRGTIDVALRRGRTAREYRQTLANLGKEVDRLIDLSENLLVLARADAVQGGTDAAAGGADGPPVAGVAVDLGAAAGKVVGRLAPMAEAKGVRLTLERGEVPAVRGDPLALERAVYNLAHNGVKFTGAGGAVTVRTFTGPAQGTGGAAAVVEVADTGPGISPEDLPHIFERFYRTDRSRRRAPEGSDGRPSDGGSGGSGLGLTIALAIARAHGGTVTAESVLGRGSTFRLVVPAAP